MSAEPGGIMSQPVARGREPSDQDLVARANVGDEASFELLYLRYRDWVISTAYRYTHSREDALDVLQETFAYLFGRFPGFDLRAKMTTFLYPVVRHLSLRVIEERARVRQPDEDTPEPAAGEPRDLESERRDLARIVRHLPEAEREVVTLRFADEMSLAEIARALEVPVGTVKSRLHKALSRLRRSLKKI